jgi:hypothetical protein
MFKWFGKHCPFLSSRAVTSYLVWLMGTSIFCACLDIVWRSEKAYTEYIVFALLLLYSIYTALCFAIQHIEGWRSAQPFVQDILNGWEETVKLMKAVVDRKS